MASPLPPDGIARFRPPLNPAISPAGSSKADDASSIENAKLHRLDRDEDVLRFLRDHFARQLKIRRNYARLFAFLSFCVIYLAILAAQRTATDAQAVTNALVGLVPISKTLAGTAEVFGWLNAALGLVYTDQTCGDRVCVAPDEFPSYGRFGCEADCGALLDTVPAGTAPVLQVSLYYNFTHSQSSIPPTALSATARWNLCPTAPLAHGSDCYFPADRPFPGVAGNATVVLADLPAGAWQVVVKGDPLWKASAGVFDYANLTRAAAGAKARIRFAVSLASDAASASWNATIAALNQTLVVSRLTGTELLLYYVRTQLAANVSLVLSDLQAGVILNSTATQLIAEAQQDADDAAALVAVQAAQCGGAPAGSTLCAAFAARQQAAVAAATADVRSSLAALDATGYRAGAASMIAGVSALSVSTPELADRISAATGTDPTDPSSAALSAIYGGMITKERLQSVALPLLQAAVVQANATLQSMASVAAVRLKELQLYPLRTFPVRPPAVPYTVARVAGGAAQYQTCNVAGRAPAYAGTCGSTASLSAPAAAACASLCTCAAPCSGSNACVCSACTTALSPTGGGAGAGAGGRHLSQFGNGDGAAAATLAVVQSVSAALADLTHKITSLVAPPATAQQQQQPVAAAGSAGDSAAADAASAVAASLRAQSSALAAAMAAALQQSNATQAAGAAAVQQAVEAGVITADSALSLLQQGAALAAQRAREAVLANTPCSASVRRLPFTVSSPLAAPPPTATTDTALLRTVATHNRLLVGVLLYTRRRTVESCANKYSKLADTCFGGPTTAPFGSDAAFRPGTALFDPFLANAADAAAAYNCSALGSAAVYAAPQWAAPRCQNLFGEDGVPLGFFPLGLKPTERDGFPVLLDVSLSGPGLKRALSQLEQGGFLDDSTEQLRARLITYNSPLRHFGALAVTFRRSAGGEFAVEASVQAARVELYSRPVDKLRLAAEVIATFAVFMWLRQTIVDMRYAKKARGRYLALIETRWDWLDFALLWLFCAVVIVWWGFVLKAAMPFDAALRYDVYANPESPVRPFALLPGGAAQLQAAADEMAKVESLAGLMTAYMTLNGFVIAALLLRSLKLMEFQPRLGLVSRTLLNAATDLLHFFILFVIVFMGYVVVGHLLFGNTVPNFATVAESARCCFEMLMGEVTVNEALNAIQGSERFAAVVFFWSFHVFLTMILLSLLLAIIVDSFLRLKEAEASVARGAEPKGVHIELGHMLREGLQWLWAPFSKRVRVGERRIAQQLAEWAAGPRGVPHEEMPKREKARVLYVGDKVVDQEQLTSILREAARSVEGFKLWGQGRKIETAMARLAPGGNVDGLTPEQQQEYAMLEQQRQQAARQEVNDAAVERAAEMLIEECGVGFEEKDPHNAQLDEALRKVVQGQRRLAVQQRAILMLMSKQLQVQREAQGSHGRGPRYAAGGQSGGYSGGGGGGYNSGGGGYSGGAGAGGYASGYGSTSNGFGGAGMS